MGLADVVRTALREWLMRESRKQANHGSEMMGTSLLLAVVEEHKGRTGHSAYTAPREDCLVCTHLRLAFQEAEREHWREVESEHAVSKATP